jgi:eukaryotic-like serine/threonine-protein kinase
MPLEGRQFGRYRLMRLLGSGGMGEVYLAEDPRIDQQVAVKVMRTEPGAYPDPEATRDASRLFEREARAIAHLDHPNTLPLYDYGETTINGSTITYMVMPYRPEGSLSTWLKQRGTSQLLSPADVAHFVRQAASALQDAHDHNIMHQDVKPANFLIRSSKDHPTRPDLQLADFGIARFSSVTTSSASQSVRGTPAYMAPEQWTGQPAPASDQYALAVMAYELLTGRAPFQGNLQFVMYQHLSQEAPPPGTFNPQLSRDVDNVFRIALAKQPEARFTSISAFANALEQALLGRPAYSDPTAFRNPFDVTLPARQKPYLPGDEAAQAIGQPFFVRQPATENQISPVTQTRYAFTPPTRETPRRGLSTGTVVLLLILVVVICAGGFLAYLLISNKNSPQTAAVNSITPLATASHATPQSSAGSAPTAATSTATSAQVNPYTHTGTLVLNDPLADNSQGWDWQTGTNQLHASCAFQNGGYDVTQPAQGYFHSCTAYNTDYRNFAFEVRVNYLSGDYVGLIFCKASANSYYLFTINTNNTFKLLRNVDANIGDAVPLTSGSVSFTSMGYIAVVADNGTISLYFNRQLIGSTSDSAFTHGQIAVLAGNDTNAAQALFTDARVWQL